MSRQGAIPDLPAIGTAPPLSTPRGRAPVVSPRRAVGVLVLLSFAAFMFVTSEILPFGLITLMATDLGTSESQIGLLVTAYAGVVVVVSIPLAHYTRHIPRRQLLTATLLVYASGMLLASLGGGFGGLLAGRMLTALSQAQFWAVVTATAAGLFPPEVRGKIVARLLIGPSAGGVIGLPTATWLGQQYGWRVPFFALAAIGALLAVVLSFLIPRYKPADGAASRGSSPNRRRFYVVLAITATAVLGSNAAYTYITPYLHDIAGFGADVIPVLLIASGVAGVASVLAAARFLDRYPRGTMGAGLGMASAGWAGVFVFGAVKPLTVAFFCLVGFGLSMMVSGLANRVMQVSPGSTDLGIATYGSLYNVGTALGSLLGAGVLAWIGPHVLPAFGAVFLAIAVGLLASEERLVRRRPTAALATR